MFSFNSPYGACPSCDGLGFKMEIDPEKVLDPENQWPKAGSPLELPPEFLVPTVPDQCRQILRVRSKPASEGSNPSSARSTALWFGSRFDSGGLPE